MLSATNQITLKCLGDAEGPRFLDGRTGDGSVGLAPATDGGFTGTHWEVVDLGSGRVGLKCLGDVEGPRFLDGRTGDGSVGLAPATDGGFTGTHWQIVESGASLALMCLGNVAGPRFLDGRTVDGSVGLAPVTEGGFTGTHWAPVSLAAARYRFGLDSFQILNTRSRHEDTVFATVSIAVSGRPPASATRGLGNLNNGQYGLGLVLDNIEVREDESAVLTYAIVNNGHSDPGAVRKVLEQALSALASKGAQAATTAIGTAVGAAVGASIGTAVVPVVGTALGALAGWLVNTTTGIVFANCDGPVAAGLHVFKGGDLKRQVAASGPIRGTDDHPGMDSPHGCGSNSHYMASWSVSAAG